MDLSGGGGVGGSCSSKSNVHDLEIDTFNNTKNNKTNKCNNKNYEKNFKHDLRYKFQLKKHIAYKVCSMFITFFKM